MSDVHDTEPDLAPYSVASVIQHTIRPGAQEAYEAWLRKIVPVARTFEGHRGIEVIRPPDGTHTYTMVLRFDTLEHLQTWLHSDTRRTLLADAEQYFARDEWIDVKTGLEFWFSPPGPHKPVAPAWKQFLITLSAVFPLSYLVPLVFRPLFHAVPWLGLPGISHFIVGSCMVGLLTYVIMPTYTRRVSKWLFS